MIHVVSGANQHLYARQLEQMFRLRTASPGVDDRDEADDASYLICLDPWGDIAASARLNPGEGGWVLSRWSGETQRSWMDSGGLARNPLHELMIGVLEFCLAREVSSLRLDIEPTLAGRFASYGWPVSLGAQRIALDPDLLAATRRLTGISEPLLIELDPKMPAA